MLLWRAEVISHLFQLDFRGPPWQLEEKSSPWQHPHKAPHPPLRPSSSSSTSSSQRPSCRGLPPQCLQFRHWPSQSASRKSIQRFLSKVRHNLFFYMCNDLSTAWSWTLETAYCEEAGISFFFFFTFQIYYQITKIFFLSVNVLFPKLDGIELIRTWRSKAIVSLQSTFRQ